MSVPCGRILLALWALLIGWLFLSNIEAWPQAKPAQIAKGESVYLAKKCDLCHMIRGKGGTIADDLSHVGAKRDAVWLRTFMENPKVVMPKAKMMPFRGSAEELEAVVAYMASLN